MTDCYDGPERRECVQRVAVAGAKIENLERGLDDVDDKLDDIQATLDRLDAKYVRIERYRLIELAVVGAVALVAVRGATTWIDDARPQPTAPQAPPATAKP